MEYSQQTIVSGGWVKASELQNGQRAKIVSEVKPVPSQFKDKNDQVKNQDVGKVHFEGQKESVNMSLNRATINGLIQAFGTNSTNWQGKYLTVVIKEAIVSGKMRDVIYLLPEGFELKKDDNGYPIVAKKEVSVDIPIIEEEIITETDLPF